MSSMEDSLRRGLEAGDAGDPAFRETIYAASERALERMLEGRGADEEEADAQRARLADTIARLEGEYAARYPEGAHAADVDEFHDEVPPEADRFEDGRDAPGDPDWTPGGGSAAAAPATGLRPVATTVGLALVFALVIAVIAYAVFATLRGGAAPEEGAPAETSSGASVGGALAWIDIFDGNDLERLATPNGGRIETVAGAGGREAVRVSGPQGGEGEVLLSIGPGVVGDIAGRRVRIELTAGSRDAEPREFSVRCVFGQVSVCDQQLFATSMDEEAFVFDVAVPDGVSAAGSIAIGPGLNGTSNDVDIYSLRIRDLS